ncbi:MAG: tetratricopeptide repeat protein [Ferruginibacter sp.]
MRNLLYVLILVLFACNNAEKGTAAAAEIPGKEKELIKLSEQYPDSAVLLETLVQYYRENGNYTSALTRMNNALKKDSNNARFWDIKANLLFENGDTLGSIHAFEKSVDLYPKPDIIISLGVLYAQTKNPKALAFADGLILADKAAAEKEALFIKGLYYSYTGDKNKAISFFDTCIKLDYTFMNAYQEKAVALYEMGKYSESLATLERATTLQNNFETGYYWMGRNYEKLNKIPDAIEAYQAAVMYDPGYIEAKDALGRLGVKN